MTHERPFAQLDFVYMPSRDVAAETDHLVGVVGAELVFAIEAFGTRVAMVQLAADSPPLLLAGHLQGERPILVYRVDDLEHTLAELSSRGLEPGPRFGIPHGPGCAFTASGGQRFAIYELTRPGAAARLAGRRDF